MVGCNCVIDELFDDAALDAATGLLRDVVATALSQSYTVLVTESADAMLVMSRLIRRTLPIVSCGRENSGIRKEVDATEEGELEVQGGKT